MLDRDLGGNDVGRLPGMQDIVGEAYSRMFRAQAGMASYLSEMGYDLIETPVMEDAELFVRKSGGELTSRLYTFTDPGGRRISLRPEFTSSVIRHFIQEGESLGRPVRWQYGGPVFRYQRAEDSGSRQFTQVGAELIGAAGAEADAEVVSVAQSCLRKTGLDDFQVRLGHLGVLHRLLDYYGLSERAVLFVIGNMEALRTDTEGVAALMGQADQLGLLRSGDGSRDSGVTLDGQASDETIEIIEGVLAGARSSSVGRRTPEQIAERLLRKIRESDDPEKLREALELMGDLTRVSGPPNVALERIESIATARGFNTSVLDELRALLAELQAKGLSESQIVLDLGLAGGISYYTGVRFEIYRPGFPEGSLLGGGGRYDGLVRALGGDDVPALGFALNLGKVLAAFDDESTAESGLSVQGPKTE